MTLLKDTMKMLRREKSKDFHEIAVRAKVTTYFIASLYYGRTNDPRVQGLQRLHDVLARRQK